MEQTKMMIIKMYTWILCAICVKYLILIVGHTDCRYIIDTKTLTFTFDSFHNNHLQITKSYHDSKANDGKLEISIKSSFKSLK